MDIVVLAVGRLKAGPERELCNRYLERARNGRAKLGLRGFAVEELPESNAKRPADRIAAEETALLSRLKERDRLYSLDARGTPIESDAFASLLGKDAEGGTPRSVFIIGGPDGLGGGVLDRSDRRLSFGKMTLPHQLVRIILAEQLYRATTILSGHPYHRP